MRRLPDGSLQRPSPEIRPEIGNAGWRGDAAPWLIGAVIVAALYFARPILVPLSLAILLSFLLAPIVAGLRRIHIPRAPAVILAVSLALGGVATIGAVITSQAATLSEDVPAYAQRITEKATNLRASLHQRFSFLTEEATSGGSGHRRTIRARQLGRAAARSTGSFIAVPVEVHDPPPTALEEIRNIVLPFVGPIETTLIVLIVTIFIMFQKDDLRDRLIRLMGAGDMPRTTLALDESAVRLSRYFLTQFAINSAFGFTIWVGLFLIGVPSPALWGILAGLLRFVPYVGTLLAALAPIALAAAVDPDWSTTIYVVLLFVIVEPVIGYLIEPLLYGHSTGLSPVSVIIAALFWVWIWGPIGLVLSMPLTLILVVLGRHIPALKIIDIMFGDRPALSLPESFYQRMLAGRADPLIDHAEAVLEDMPIARYFDEVALPGLQLAAQDFDRGVLSRSTLRAAGAVAVDLVAALTDHDDITGNGASPDKEQAAATILCISARGPLDGAIGAMLAILLARRGCTVREVHRGEATEAALAEWQGSRPDAVCIAGLFDDRSGRRLELLAQQIRSVMPDAQVIVGPYVPSSSSDDGLHNLDRVCAALLDPV